MVKRFLAVDGVEKQIERYAGGDGHYLTHAATHQREQIANIYEKAVWVDAQLNGSCIVDPFFNFHFYDESDAMAFKLKWEE